MFAGNLPFLFATKRGKHQLDYLALLKAMACWQWKPASAQLAMAALQDAKDDDETPEPSGSGLFTE